MPKTKEITDDEIKKIKQADVMIQVASIAFQYVEDNEHKFLYSASYFRKQSTNRKDVNEIM